MLQQELVHHEPGPLLRQVTHFGGNPARNKKISVKHESEKNGALSKFQQKSIKSSLYSSHLALGDIGREVASEEDEDAADDRAAAAPVADPTLTASDALLVRLIFFSVSADSAEGGVRDGRLIPPPPAAAVAITEPM